VGRWRLRGGGGGEREQVKDSPAGRPAASRRYVYSVVWPSGNQYFVGVLIGGNYLQSVFGRNVSSVSATASFAYLLVAETCWWIFIETRDLSARSATVAGIFSSSRRSPSDRPADVVQDTQIHRTSRTGWNEGAGWQAVIYVQIAGTDRNWHNNFP